MASYMSAKAQLKNTKYFHTHCKEPDRSNNNEYTRWRYEGPHYNRKEKNVHNCSECKKRANCNHECRNNAHCRTFSDTSLHERRRKHHLCEDSRTMLNRIEEAYWATWKPNKNKIERFNLRKEFINKIEKPVIKCFVKKDFCTSTDSVRIDEKRWRHVKTNSQEIQTDDFLLPIPPLMKTVEIETNREENCQSVQTSSSTVQQVHKEISKEHISLTQSHENESLFLSNDHSDSTSPTRSSVSSKEGTRSSELRYYRHKIRGGSYPLTSSFRSEPLTRRDNFQLGPPGSPLFLTSHSYNKKFSR